MPAAPAALSPQFTLLLALVGLLVPAVGAVVVAFVNRGGASKSVPMDANLVMPRSEYDRLVERLGDLDEELHRASREAEHLREDRDRWQSRAYGAGWKDMK